MPTFTLFIIHKYCIKNAFLDRNHCAAGLLAATIFANMSAKGEPLGVIHPNQLSHLVGSITPLT